MDIKVTFDIVGPDISFDDALAIIDSTGEKILPGYTDAKKIFTATDLWRIKINNSRMINNIRCELEKKLPTNAYIQENIIPEGIRFDKSDQEWFITFSFADDASNAEITHHTDSEITCKTCGNKQQNSNFVPAIKPSKLPARPKLMTFYAPLKLFCRPKFIKRYEQSGLTGLTFIDWDEKDKHGQPLTLIKVERHQWQDRTGVCDVCEMKTNVTTAYGLFNTHEKFKYDIQYVNTYDSQDFVLSRKAVEFFLEVTDFMEGIYRFPETLIPIMPGYLEDIVWPEPKLFAHGEIPLHMLRSSWEKK